MAVAETRSRPSDDGSSYARHPKDLDVSHGTFATPDLSAFCLLDDHGLTVTGQEISPDKAVLECRVTDRDPFCRGCGAEGVARGTQARRLAHVPLGWRPTTLLVRVRRFACFSCGTIWREDTTAAAEPRGKLTRAAVRWALEAVVCQHLPVARVAESLDVSWPAANDAVLTEGRRLLIDDPARFDGVTMNRPGFRSYRFPCPAVAGRPDSRSA